METFTSVCKGLQERVCEANLALHRSGLIVSTFGNVSEKIVFDGQNLIGIKPSGVAYSKLTSHDVPLLDESGGKLKGELRPSTDTPTHLVLYKMLPHVYGVTHTHSTFASSWAQAELDIPPLGTTHADYAEHCIPCTGPLTAEDIDSDYEMNTGKAIVDRLKSMNNQESTMVLVRNHGPFTMGKDAMDAVENAILLEEIAKMAYYTNALNPIVSAINRKLHDKHYKRKHGSSKYYGQN
jgi:L-ribulose-5-phosphate 4-epimerase